MDSESVGFQGSDYNVNSQYDESDKIGTCDNKTEPVGTESINYNYQDEYDKYSEKDNVDSETEEFETAKCNFSYQYDEDNKIDMFNHKTEPMSGENINYNYNYQYDLCNKDGEKDSFKSEVNHEHESFQTASYDFSYQYDENDRVNISNNEPESEPGYRYENNTMNEWYKEILARTENEENIHFDSDDENSETIKTKIENFKQMSPIVNARSDENVGINVTIRNIEPSTEAKANNKVSCIKPKANNVVKDVYKSETSSSKKVKASKKRSKTEPIASIIENTKYNLKPRADLSVKNNFIGFVPSIISTPPIGGGGANLPPLSSVTPSLISVTPPLIAVAPPIISAVLPNSPIGVNTGGGVPLTPRPTLVNNNNVGSSTPININFVPAPLNMTPIININESADNAALPRENIIPSVNVENPIVTLNNSLNTLPCLEESGLNLDPFSGFPSLDSSDERTMSRIEALLDNPRGLSFTFENNIVEPPVQIDIIPEVLIPNLIPNVVASPERVNRSRLPIPVIVNSPPAARLRSTNKKPTGFYKN
ncbi:unnamed protein product [Rotaria magnacalcarata]|uniref:Uncharacterized protein n=1 Tax=Rotaria magnacalcarata TaxID=392030 RepID=A0A820F570_9BILA|nr:unnamed protein product [Rotaria magnacalcarata]